LTVAEVYVVRNLVLLQFVNNFCQNVPNDKKLQRQNFAVISTYGLQLISWYNKKNKDKSSFFSFSKKIDCSYL